MTVMMFKMKVILVDQDGVLADFEGGFLQNWKLKYPDRFYVPFEKRVTVDIEPQYPKEFENDIKEIMCSKGFVRSLLPKQGGLEAVIEMRNNDHEVFICTSPLSKSKYCVQEKYEWVEEHLGSEWKKRIIVTKDKTLIFSDYLIDDRPVIKGVRNPLWEHILYDSPYNQDMTSKRRLTWDNWKEILGL